VYFSGISRDGRKGGGALFVVAVAGGIYAARSAAAPPYGPAGEIFFILALFLKENHKNTVQIWPAREYIFVEML
jgi:hypothetical protein